MAARSHAQYEQNHIGVSAGCRTRYCYDFPAVFETALREVWAARAAAGEPNAFPPSGRLCVAEELVLSNATGGQRAYRCAREVCDDHVTINLQKWAPSLSPPGLMYAREFLFADMRPEYMQKSMELSHSGRMIRHFFDCQRVPFGRHETRVHTKKHGAVRGPCQLERCSRPGGKNDCGMVVWALTLRTPECPQLPFIHSSTNKTVFSSIKGAHFSIE
eukprot:scaffold40328_cov19-Tisochrysis_lutea.AAC.1